MRVSVPRKTHEDADIIPTNGEPKRSPYERFSTGHGFDEGVCSLKVSVPRITYHPSRGLGPWGDPNEVNLSNGLERVVTSNHTSLN